MFVLEFSELQNISPTQFGWFFSCGGAVTADVHEVLSVTRKRQGQTAWYCFRDVIVCIQYPNILKGLNLISVLL